jgi:hypothetical protein
MPGNGHRLRKAGAEIKALRTPSRVRAQRNLTKMRCCAVTSIGVRSGIGRFGAMRRRPGSAEGG